MQDIIFFQGYTCPVWKTRLRFHADDCSFMWFWQLAVVLLPLKVLLNIRACPVSKASTVHVKVECVYAPKVPLENKTHVCKTVYRNLLQLASGQMRLVKIERVYSRPEACHEVLWGHVMTSVTVTYKQPKHCRTTSVDSDLAEQCQLPYTNPESCRSDSFWQSYSIHNLQGSEPIIACAAARLSRCSHHHRY